MILSPRRGARGVAGPRADRGARHVGHACGTPMTAVLKEYLLRRQIAQHSQIRRMAQRLSIFTDLEVWRSDAPRWRPHGGDGVAARRPRRSRRPRFWGRVPDTLRSSRPVIRARALLARLPAAARDLVEHNWRRSM